MNEDKNEQAFDEVSTPLSAPPSYPPTPRRKRIIALIGAILMIALTILYAYSIATGKIFAF